MPLTARCFYPGAAMSHLESETVRSATSRLAWEDRRRSAPATTSEERGETEESRGTGRRDHDVLKRY